MIDDLFEIALAAAIDVETGKATRKHRWLRIFRALVGLSFFALLAGAINVTIKYA